MSRIAAASALAGVAASGRRSRAAWVFAVLAASVADWVDGPLARATGTVSELGAVLDLEADSWLTMWCAIAAYRTGGLPAWCLLAPALRYPIAIRRRRPGSRLERAAGTFQMLILLGALAPTPALRRAARRLAPAAGAVQLAALLAASRSISSR